MDHSVGHNVMVMWAIFIAWDVQHSISMKRLFYFQVGPPTWKDRFLLEKFPMFVAYFMDKLLKLVSVVKLELLIAKFKEC